MNKSFAEPLEDGELSSSEENYTPLERPANYTTVVQPILNVLPEEVETDDELKSSCDSDSDYDNKPKQPKIKPKNITIPKNSTKKKYDIWCSSVQEEVLLENLVNCDVSNIDRSRNVETYVSIKNKRTHQNRKSVFMRLGKRTNFQSRDSSNDSATKLDSYITLKDNKRKHSDRKNRRLRPNRRTDYPSVGELKCVRRTILDLNVTINDSVEEIAKDIANKLCEEKETLIRSVIETVGKQKAMDLFKETQQVEEKGGMMIRNNTRRRTPGGIFFNLVKNDDEITTEQQGKIFFEDKLKHKKDVRTKNKVKYENLRIKIKAARSKESAVKNETPELDIKDPPLSPAPDDIDNSSDAIQGKMLSRCELEIQNVTIKQDVKHLQPSSDSMNDCTGEMDSVNNPELVPKTDLDYKDDVLDIGLDMDIF